MRPKFSMESINIGWRKGCDIHISRQPCEMSVDASNVMQQKCFFNFANDCIFLSDYQKNLFGKKYGLFWYFFGDFGKSAHLLSSYTLLIRMGSWLKIKTFGSKFRILLVFTLHDVKLFTWRKVFYKSEEFFISYVKMLFILKFIILKRFYHRVQ